MEELVLEKDEERKQKEDERKQKEEERKQKEELKVNFAKKMKKYGESVDSIKKETGLTEEEIEKL